MDCHDALSQIFVVCVLEPLVLDHLQQGLLVVKLLDRLYQILVRLSIVCNELAHHWDDVEGVKSVHLGEWPPCYFRKLQTTELASSLQHSVCFCQSFRCSGDVPQSKRNSVRVKGVRLEGELLSVCADKLNIWVTKVVPSEVYPNFSALYFPYCSIDSLMSSTVTLRSELLVSYPCVFCAFTES